MMESRKRPHAEDDEGTVTKKRVLSSATDSPIPVTPILDSHFLELGDDDPVTNFQKVAIYRRMRQYRREHERGQARIAQLERSKGACEAELAAVDASWTQLVDVIGSLVDPTALEVSAEQEDVMDIVVHTTTDAPPELVQSLRDRMRLTQRLVAVFVKSAGQAQPPSSQELYRKCQSAQAECSSLRSELRLMHSRLQAIERDRDNYHELLIAAEASADRMLSQAMLSRTKSEAKTPEANDEMKAEEEPSNAPTPVPPEDSPIANGINGVHTVKYEPDDAVETAIRENREKRIQDLEKEVESLHLRLFTKKSSSSKEEVESSSHYQELANEASLAIHEADVAKKELAETREMHDSLISGREEWEKSVIEQATKDLEETKNVLRKRDQENVRLREQRDQQAAEISERKAQSQVKQAHADEYGRLAASRADRIAVLDSENKRLKTRLAAASGDDDLYAFLANDAAVKTTYVDDLQRRLKDNGAKYEALDSVLNELRRDQPDLERHVSAEAEAKQQIIRLQRQLSKYQAIVDSDSASSDLFKQLEVKEEQLHVLRLKEKQRDEAEASMYVELDKLSAAWEALDKQVKSKVFDLSAMEERLTKHNLEKAKADNKFFAAMRDKEASEFERKNALRNVEKQAKLIENLTKSEKALNATVVGLEKELTMTQKALAMHRASIEKTEKDSRNVQRRLDSKESDFAETVRLAQDRERELHLKRNDISKLKDELVRAKKESESLTEKLKKELSTRTHSTGEAVLQAELDKCMRILKCSTCHNAMRSTCITKCMHTFCKPCVDARLHHRQRKCPACNVQFAQSEVQTIFFQ